MHNINYIYRGFHASTPTDVWKYICIMHMYDDFCPKKKENYANTKTNL